MNSANFSEGPSNQDQLNGEAVSKGSQEIQEKKLTVNGAKDYINSLAAELQSLGEKDDISEAAEIKAIAAGLENGSGESYEKAYQYLGDIEKSTLNLLDVVQDETIRTELQEKLSMIQESKDALFLEMARAKDTEANKAKIDALNIKDEELSGPKIAELKKALGIEESSDETSATPLPEGRRDLARFQVKEFKEFSRLSLENFKEQFGAEKEQTYSDWAKKWVQTLINEKPDGVSYIDNVASVLGNETFLTQRILAKKTGVIVPAEKVATMPFSQFAEIIGIELPDDYRSNFSNRPRIEIAA